MQKLQEKPVEEQSDVQATTGDAQNAKAVQEDVNGEQMEQVSLADDGK